MKKILIPSIIAASILTYTSCDVLESAASTITTPTQAALTNDEVIAGLKEALEVGIKNSVDVTSVTDGFLQNSEIRLPFPQDALKVKQKALDLGLDAQVEKFETTLNRAAEEAVKAATPIFVTAIKNMSIQDGFQILRGGNNSATNYLQNATTTELKVAFRPKVDDAISKVKLTEYWNPIITKYNQVMTLTGGEKLNPDLSEYVTLKAIDGLFTMVAKEENKIRENPGARVTDLLQRVFGSVK